MHEAREPVAGRAAHAVAVGRVLLEQADAARRVERLQPRGREVVGELLDPRLVADRRERVGRRGRRLGRVLAARAVDLVALLGERVVRLELVVGDRPGRRDPVVVGQLAEVLRAQPVQRGAVELRRTADVVVDLRLERRCRARRTRCRARRSGSRRRRRAPAQFAGSRGSQPPRSSSRIRLPDGARWRASVPPPAPLPITMTSKWLIVPPTASASCRGPRAAGRPRPAPTSPSRRDGPAAARPPAGPSPATPPRPSPGA